MSQQEVTVYLAEPFHPNVKPGAVVTLGDSYRPMTVTWISQDRHGIKLTAKGES